MECDGFFCPFSQNDGQQKVKHHLWIWYVIFFSSILPSTTWLKSITHVDHLSCKKNPWNHWQFKWNAIQMLWPWILCSAARQAGRKEKLGQWLTDSESWTQWSGNDHFTNPHGCGKACSGFRGSHSFVSTSGKYPGLQLYMVQCSLPWKQTKNGEPNIVYGERMKLNCILLLQFFVCVGRSFI